MRTIKILFFLLTLSTTFVQAQSGKKTVEIFNDKGDLFISFENETITAFTINETPVAKERYPEYQKIMDDFADEEIQLIDTPLPEVPVEESKSDRLKKLMIDYLMNNGNINSYRKYKVELKKQYLKINGDKMPLELHHICLDFFKQIYGEKLNKKSKVYFKRSGDKSKSSINLSY